MNNKILIGAIAILVIIGAAIVMTTKTNNTPAQPDNTQTINPTQSQTIPPTITRSDITLNKDGFSPQTLTVKVGTVVTWINASGAKASVNSAQHPTHQVYSPLNLGEFGDGSSVQLIFDKAGSYKYHDHFHPERTGTVIVE